MNKLYQIFWKVKDKRALRGRRYPLFAILNLILLSKLCGAQSIKEAWVLSRELHPKQWFSLGFRRHERISYSALLEALQYVDVSSLERALSSCHVSERHLAVDGKAIGGRTTQEGDAYHLVSLFGTGLRSVWGQVRSKKGGGEIKAALDLIRQLDIRDTVITGDALYVNAQLCEAIVGKGGDYALTLKSNQPGLRHEMLQIFRLNPWKNHPDVVRSYEEQIDKAHGRIEMRKIEVMNSPYTHYQNGFSTIRQVARITRYRHVVGTQPHEAEATISYMITSLDSGKTTPKELLELNRGHWAIENLLHRHRDVLYAEDKGTLRSKEAPHVNAALNNIGLKLLSDIRKTSDSYRSLSLKHLAGTLSRKLTVPIKLLSA